MVDALLSVASQLAEEDGEDFQIFVEHGTPPKISPSNPIRQCEFCKSTETPAWRRGPAGKGSLCNACGIKWRLKKKVKKNDDIGRSDIGKKMSGVRKAVGRPPKKHPKLLLNKQFIESKKYLCKSCNLETDAHDFKKQFEVCRSCSKRNRNPSDFPRYHFNSSPSSNVTIAHDRSRTPAHNQDTIVVSRKLDVYELDHVRDGLQNMKSELLIEQELVEHEDQLAALKLNAARELNELKIHAISRIREFEQLRIAQLNSMVGSMFANLSACEQFQQEIIGRARHL